MLLEKTCLGMVYGSKCVGRILTMTEYFDIAYLYAIADKKFSVMTFL